MADDGAGIEIEVRMIAEADALLRAGRFVAARRTLAEFFKRKWKFIRMSEIRNNWTREEIADIYNKPVLELVYEGADSIAARWLIDGAAGWRLDVMGDASFPNGYWETFRQATKTTKSDALIIGELWQKDSTLLRFLRGDRADSTMNYRLRDALLEFLAPQNFGRSR